MENHSKDMVVVVVAVAVVFIVVEQSICRVAGTNRERA